MLPIKSDPTNPDSDGDTVDDVYDAAPLVPYLILSDCIYEDDNTHSVSRHALLVDLDDDKLPIYRCLNCDEIFLPPERQDIEILNEQEYALINAIGICISDMALCGEMNDNTLNQIESLYMVIDKIREGKVVDNVSFYDYADETSIGRSYISPMEYKFTSEKKRHMIGIDITQVTAVDLYMDLMLETTVSHGIEFLIGNVDIKKLDDGYINALSIAMSVYDLVESICVTKEDIIENSANLVMSIAGIWIPKPVGNTILTIQYLHSVYTVNESYLNHNLPNNMFIISVEIIDSESGITAYKMGCMYNHREELYFDKITNLSSKESLLNNPELYNMFSINNNTNGTIPYSSVFNNKYPIIN